MSGAVNYSRLYADSSKPRHISEQRHMKGMENSDMSALDTIPVIMIKTVK